jgi:hypothetical protein
MDIRLTRDGRAQLSPISRLRQLRTETSARPHRPNHTGQLHHYRPSHENRSGDQAVHRRRKLLLRIRDDHIITTTTEPP